MTVEKRWFGDYKGTTATLETRDDRGGKKYIRGYGAVFNRNSQDLGGFVEQVLPGAFTKTIQEADVRALINHDSNILLGRNKADTLTLAEDGTGLGYVIDPPDTQAARDWMTLLERGDISQSSFSFRVIEDEWGLTPDERVLRSLRQVALYDVGPVTFPAYLDASSGVGARSMTALAGLAEKRSEKLETVLELAKHGELKDLIKDGIKPTERSDEPQREHITVKTEARDMGDHDACCSPEPVEGSYEALACDLGDAIEDWAEANLPVVDACAHVNATFVDHVIATICGEGLDDEGVAFDFPYVANGDGTYTIGTGKQVELVTAVMPAEAEDIAELTNDIAVADYGMNSHEDSEKRTSIAIARARLDLMAKSQSWAG